MAITFGNDPDDLTVLLTSGADFTQTLSNEDEDWPAGANIELRFGDTVWPATITGPDADWDVDKAAVAEVIDANVRTVSLFYDEGAADVCWAKGRVEVR